MTSNSQNDLVQEVAKLRSKMKTLELLKKDDLVKQLEAKEQECLEYRTKLNKIEPQTIQEEEEEDKPVEMLESEVIARMTELREIMA